MLSGEIWHFLAGLGFFLFAMNMLEGLLKKTSGRSLKIFLNRHTRNLFKAIAGGALVTAVVQSSSVVSLIVLAFVESGIITFRNALGVILGSNLGTTLSNWIVATVGFKIDIMVYTLPIIAVTTIAMFAFEKRKYIHNIFSVLFSIGILFLGLEFMKQGALETVKEFDFSALGSQKAYVFVLAGFVLTTIIQSSSATVAIALTAIYSGALPLQAAAAVVIGSEVGTTVKIVFWGMKGSADKKRVAYGNFIYNIFTALIAYISLNWLMFIILNTLGVADHLVALVLFQTSINILSIILFLPFIRFFSAWLEKTFRKNRRTAGSYLDRSMPLIPMLATDAMRLEAEDLLRRTLSFNKTLLSQSVSEPEGLFRNLQALTQATADTDEEYRALKETEGNMLSYFAEMQARNPESGHTRLMLQYLNSSRHTVYSAKAVKDIAHNLKEFMASANNLLHRQPVVIRNDWISFDSYVTSLVPERDAKTRAQQAGQALKEAVWQEEKHRQEVIRWMKKEYLNEVEASTYLNMGREILASKKAILQALMLLEPDTDQEASQQEIIV